MKAICAIVAGLMLPGIASAGTISVPGDYATIQGAVDAASNGEVTADDLLSLLGVYGTNCP